MATIPNSNEGKWMLAHNGLAIPFPRCDEGEGEVLKWMAMLYLVKGSESVPVLTFV
jgi:hypothetical protein